MCTGAEIAVLGMMAASTATTVHQGNKANRLQEQALRQAAQQKPVAPPKQQAAEVAPAMAARTGRGPRPGAAATMLTGPSGVSNNTLNIGRTTLLGG